MAGSADAFNLCGRCNPMVAIGENDVVTGRAGRAGSNSSNVGRELAAVRSHEERSRLIRAVLKIIGFSSFACRIYQMNGLLAVREFLLKTYATSQFSLRYSEENYHGIDPRISEHLNRRCRISGISFFMDSAHHSESLGRVRELLSHMNRDEVRSALMFGLLLSLGMRCMLSFSLQYTQTYYG